MTIILWQADVFVTCSVVNTTTYHTFGVTVTNNSPPYATVMMSCLLTLFITLIYCDQTVGWIKDGVQVGPVPVNSVTDSASPHGKRHCRGGGVSGVITVSQLMQPCD